MKAREWCKLPYPGHTKGCPNYNNRPSCPPGVSLIEEFLNLQRPIHLIIVSFDLLDHIANMLGKHPEWSIRQAKCVLYWQGGVNKRLVNECKVFTKLNSGTITTICTEAMGVNVIETARHCGIPIQTKPTDWVYKIAIGGYPV